MPRYRPEPRQPGDQVDSLVKEYLDAARPGNDYPGDRGGARIQVAVLDTWPRAEDGSAGLEGLREFRDNNRAGMNKRLDDAIDNESILAAADVHDDYVPGAGFGLRCHHIDISTGQAVVDSYNMRDHGLFVADIIKDVAPAARLVVHRVLDDFGVGDMHTVGTALQEAIEADRPPGTRLVINLSLGFGPTLLMTRSVLDQPERYLSRATAYVTDSNGRSHVEPRLSAIDVEQLVADGLIDPGTTGAASDISFIGALEALEHMFGFQLDGVDADGVLVVAASGNDSAQPTRVFAPRAPAAIEGILGVSAIQDLSGTFAPYSNADDLRDPDDGIGAFGGGQFGAPTEVPAPVALFVSEQIPPNEPGTNNINNPANADGWAMWRGTSFAAPVAAGIAACIWSEDPAGLTAQDVLRAIVFDGGVSRPFIHLRQQ